jgi:hypothetical protein
VRGVTIAAMESGCAAVEGEGGMGWMRRARGGDVEGGGCGDGVP